MRDEQCLLQQYREVVRHGQGRITINVGPYSTDKTSILIEAGKTHRFIVNRSKVLD